MADVTLRYGPAKVSDPLSEREEGRLRTLAAKTRLSPQEEYDLGALRGRAKRDPAGQRLLEDVAHGQASRQPVTQRTANSMVARAVRDAIAKRQAEGD